MVSRSDLEIIYDHLLKSPSFSDFLTKKEELEQEKERQKSKSKACRATTFFYGSK